MDFPIDVLFSPVHRPLISWGSITSPLAYAPGPHAEAVETAAQMLKAAVRPAILIGTGAKDVCIPPIYWSIRYRMEGLI